MGNIFEDFRRFLSLFSSFRNFIENPKNALYLETSGSDSEVPKKVCFNFENRKIYFRDRILTVQVLLMIHKILENVDRSYILEKLCMSKFLIKKVTLDVGGVIGGLIAPI